MLILLLLASCRSHKGGEGAAPKRVVVPPSIAADCSKPVDDELAAFLGKIKDGSTVVFQPNGCYAHNRVITLRARNGITIEGSGATFKKLTTANPGAISLNGHWRLSAGSNLTIQNLKVQGQFAPPPRGTVGQGLNYEHGVAIWGTQGATVRNVEVSNVDGDCVTVDPDIDAAQDPRIGGDYRLVSPSRDVTVDGVTCAHAGRHGFASTHGERITLSNSTFSDIQQNGADVEIDHPAGDGKPSEKNNNIKIVGNTFKDFYFSAIAVPIGQSPDVGNIEMRGNVVLTPSETCYPAVYVGDARFRLDGIYITENQLITIGDGIRLVGVDSGEVARNVIRYVGNHACTNSNFTPPTEVPVREFGGSVAIANNNAQGFLGGLDRL